jgi:hypothetical protein
MPMGQGGIEEIIEEREVKQYNSKHQHSHFWEVNIIMHDSWDTPMNAISINRKNDSSDYQESEDVF